MTNRGFTRLGGFNKIIIQVTSLMIKLMGTLESCPSDNGTSNLLTETAWQFIIEAILGWVGEHMYNAVH